MNCGYGGEGQAGRLADLKKDRNTKTQKERKDHAETKGIKEQNQRAAHRSEY